MYAEPNATSFRFRLRSEPPRVAIVGAAGGELLRVLEKRAFPLAELRLFAPPRSAGKLAAFAGREIAVEPLTARSFSGVDLALLSAGAAIARECAPRAVRSGAIVIDNSSAYRMDRAVPLVVPEINGAAIETHRGVIANPNCVAIIALMALAPIHRRNLIRRAILATYQGAPGGGAAAMQELIEATRADLAGEAYPPRHLLHPYAFNLLSQNTPVDRETGCNGEEAKIIGEAERSSAIAQSGSE